MNTLPLLAGNADAQHAITMTSREIAVLTGKQHGHVKRDIESMLKELEKDVSSFGCIYLDAMNRQQTEYHLDRDLTMTLITGYSAALRFRVIVRLRELEREASQPRLPTNQPPFRFRVNTGRPEVDDQLNLIQAVAERLPINNEVRAAMLVQFLREQGVPLNIARTDLLRCNCAEDILDYGRGFKGAYDLSRIAGRQADKQEAAIESATESPEGTLEAALMRAFALPGRGVRWMTGQEILKVAGLEPSRPSAIRAGDFLSKFCRVERKRSNRGAIYNMPPRRD